MTKWAKAKQGYKFIPGPQAGSAVKTKFEGNLGKQYKRAVPEGWIGKGYAVEVEDSDCGGA